MSDLDKVAEPVLELISVAVALAKENAAYEELVDKLAGWLSLSLGLNESIAPEIRQLEADNELLRSLFIHE